METPLGYGIENGISIGDAIEINQRVIYPVARTSVLKICGKISGCWIAPLALLITEPDNSYAISLTEEDIPLDQILALAPRLMKLWTR